jgi:uncharacterized protein (TIGR04222 family)
MLGFINSLTGPEFLRFFTIYSLAVMAIGWLVHYQIRRSVKLVPGQNVLERELKDPYAIAYLRGGLKEVIMCAVIALDQRKHLRIGEETIRVRQRPATRDILHPVEKEVFEAASKRIQPYELLSDLEATLRLKEFEQTTQQHLQRLGLWLPEDSQHRLKSLLLLTQGAILIPGIYRLIRGLLLGRPVLFLVGLMVIFPLLTLGLIKPTQRTLAGDHFLAGLKHTFSFLGDGFRRQLRMQPMDVLMAAAIFGLTTGSFGGSSRYRKAFATPRTSSAWVGCGGGCGVGCGGGGGCGGGCGGCGGT